MTLLLNCNSLPNVVENIHRLSNFTPSHQPTLCNTLYKLPLIDKKIPINVLDVIDMVFFGLLMIFLAYSYLIVRRGTGKGLNFARRYIILPIYYTFLKVSLFSACLSVAYLTVKLYFKTPPWIVYVLGGLVNTLEESIAFFLLQQSSGRYHMSNVAKVSITWGVFASISWVILMFATNTDDVNDYKHVYYQSIYWIGVGGLLFIFYLWIFLLRCIPILNFGGKIEPRPAVYVYSFYLMVAYGAWTAGGIYYLITKEDIVFCIWFFGNAFFFALRAPIVYYTFYIDSIHWRSIPGVKFNSKGGSIIDNNNAILPRQPDDEESALINSTVSKFGNLRLLDFSRLKIEWKVGQGATATVWKGILDSRREVAIKQFSCPVLDMNIIEEFLTEASLMSKLDHVNIVRYMGLCVQPPDVTEFCHLGSLFDIVHLKRQKFRWEQLVKLAIDCTKGVAYLHSMGIIHRDIKSLNFLLDKYWTVKVADFGQSRHIDYEETMTGNRGTLQWMAPEVIDRKRYSEKADVYSLAVVFFEMYTQHIPFEDFAIQDLLDAVCVQGLRPDIPDECPREFAKLLQECWSADPEQRPNIDQVLARLLRMRPPGVAVFPDFKDKAPRELRFMSLQEGHTS